MLAFEDNVATDWQLTLRWFEGKLLCTGLYCTGPQFLCFKTEKKEHSISLATDLGNGLSAGERESLETREVVAAAAWSGRCGRGVGGGLRRPEGPDWAYFQGGADWIY